MELVKKEDMIFKFQKIIRYNNSSVNKIVEEKVKFKSREFQYLLFIFLACITKDAIMNKGS